MIGLCALLAPLALHAGDIYVPLAANTALGASTYRTLLILTNVSPAGTASADLSVRFLAGGTNGTTGQPAPSSLSLPAGATLRLYNAVPAGARGMFELTGAPGIVVSARVEALAANGNVLASAQVPVVSAANAVAPGKTARLLGLEQAAAGPASDLGLINLSGSSAQCTVDVFRAKGGRIGETVRLTLLPLSSRDLPGALGALGEPSIKDVRFDVSCDQLFATYALVYRSGGPETVLLGPAASLEGDLVPVSDGGVTFSLPGQFANGTAYAAYDLPLQDGVQYSHARVEFDLFLDRWHQLFPFNPMFHNVASFRRSANSRSDRLLYWGLILKGSGDFRTILDMGQEDTIKSGKGPWKEHTNYHLVLDYDADARRMTFEAYQGGQRIQHLEGPLNFTDIFNLPDRKVRVDFSSLGIGDGAYFPTLGWKYSNLMVKLTPRGKDRAAAAGELIVPISAGAASDGTASTTRLWVTNSGGVARRLTYTFIAPGADGTKVKAGGSLSIPAGETVLAKNLAPAGKSGMLLVSGAPQLLITPRLEASGANGALRAATAGPVVSGLVISPGDGTLHLHGLTHRQGGLITDLYVINASRQAAQCTVDAFRDTGTPIGTTLRLTLPPLSSQVVEKALAGFGATSIDEARLAISCGQAFYTYARVAKPGSAELNIVTPAPALGRGVLTP